MADHYNYFCRRCGVELLEWDAKRYEVVRVLQCAPALGAAAKELLRLDPSADVEVKVHLQTFDRSDLEWFAEHGDHELEPSL